MRGEEGRGEEEKRGEKEREDKVAEWGRCSPAKFTPLCTGNLSFQALFQVAFIAYQSQKSGSASVLSTVDGVFEPGAKAYNRTIQTYF